MGPMGGMDPTQQARVAAAMGSGGSIFTGAWEPKQIPDLNFLGLGSLGTMVGNALLASPYGMQAMGMMPAQFLPQANLYDQFRAKEYYQQQQQAMQMASQADRLTYRQFAENIIRQKTGADKLSAEQMQWADNMGGLAASLTPFAIQMFGPDMVDAFSGRAGSATALSLRMLQGGRTAMDPVTGLTGLSGASAGMISGMLHRQFFGPGADIAAFRGLTAGRVGGLYDELQHRGLMGPSIAAFSEEQQFDMLADSLTSPNLQRTSPEAYKAILRRERQLDPLLLNADDATVAARFAGHSLQERRDALVDMDKMQPGMIDTLKRGFDAQQAGNRLKDLAGAFAAVGDLLGPGTPSEQLFETLEKLTQHGTSRFTPQMLERSVQMTHSLMRTAGVSMDTMMALMGRGAGLADALGVDRMTAVQATQGAIAFGQAYGQSKAAGVPNFQAITKDEMTLLDQQLRVQAAGSGMANQLGATIRYAETVRRSGGVVGGDIGALVEAVESGKTTFTGADGRERSVFLKQKEWRQLMEDGGADMALAQQMLNQRHSNQEPIVQHGLGDLVRNGAQRAEIQRYAAIAFRGSIMAELGRRGITGDKAERLALLAGQAASAAVMGMGADQRRNHDTRTKTMADALNSVLGREGVRLDAVSAAATAESAWGAYNETVHNTAALRSYRTGLASFEAVDPEISKRQKGIEQENVIAGATRSLLAGLGAQGPLARLAEVALEPPATLKQAIGRLLGGVDPKDMQARLSKLRGMSPEELNKLGITDKDKVAVMTEQLVLAGRQYATVAAGDAQTPQAQADRKQQLQWLQDEMEAIRLGGTSAQKRLAESLKEKGFSTLKEALASDKITDFERQRYQALAFAAKIGLSDSSAKIKDVIESAQKAADNDPAKVYKAIEEGSKNIPGVPEKKDDQAAGTGQKISGTLTIVGLDKVRMDATVDAGGGHGSTPAGTHG